MAQERRTRWISVAAAAAMGQVSYAVMYRLVLQGAVVCQDLAGRRVVDAESVRRWKRRRDRAVEAERERAQESVA